MNLNDSNSDEQLWWMSNQPSLPSQPKHQRQPKFSSQRDDTSDLGKQAKYEIDIHQVPRSASGKLRPIPPPEGLTGPVDESWLRDTHPLESMSKAKNTDDGELPRERWPFVAAIVLLIVLIILGTRLIPGNTTTTHSDTTTIYAVSTSTSTVAPTETTISSASVLPTNTSAPLPTATPISQVAVVAAPPTATPVPVINYNLADITVQCHRADGAQCNVAPYYNILNCFGVPANQPCEKSICKSTNTQGILFNTGDSVTFQCAMYPNNPANIIQQLVGTCFQGNYFAGSGTCYSTIIATKYDGQ